MINQTCFVGMVKNGGRMILVILAAFLTMVPLSGASQSADKKSGASLELGHKYKYSLWDKKYIESLYPKKGTNGYPDSTERIIEDFIKKSLDADHISYKSVKVSAKPRSYSVVIATDGANAAKYYVKVQPKILSKNISGQALNGVNDCKAAGDNCWNPLSGYETKDGPILWDLFLPLGLPMVNQKIVMLLHYPPYVSLQQHSYLDNNTMRRWERMLKSVGVPQSDYTLYENIVDINPIAAPGSGQSDYLPTLMATFLFDSPKNKRMYVTPMLATMADPPSNTSKENTRPVIVFGAQAGGYWTVKYKKQLQPDPKKTPYFGVLSAGSLQMDGISKKQTPYLGANHPIAAVYQTCTSSPGIVKMVEQDLTTACYAKTFGDDPNSNWKTVIDTCKSAWLDNPGLSQQSTICINARLDMNKAPDWDAAKTWCDANNQNPCADQTAQSAASTEITPHP